MKITMSSQRSIFVALVLGVAALAGFYSATGSTVLQAKPVHVDSAAQAPRVAPDFELKDLDGKVHHLSDYKGKVVILNFWATWCPPCKKEIPDFIEMQKQYEAQGVQFLGIAMDDEGLDKVKPWVASHNLSYPILLPDGKVAASYGEMSSIPVTYFIDRKGMIRQTFVGMRTRPIFEKDLTPLISEK